MPTTLEGSALQAMQTLRTAYRDREAAARTAAREGRKVVGYISNNVPEELILAAGMFPVQITGDPTEDTAVGDRYMEDFNDANVRSLFDRILRGHFDYLDLIIVPRSSESYLQLYYYLLEARNWEPDRRFPEIYLFDLLQTPFYITGRYVRDRMDALRLKLQTVARTAITEQRLSDAIDLTNASRHALASLNAIRRRAPAFLSGTDMLRATGASTFMDKAGHTAIVEAIVAGSGGDLPSSDRPRIMVKGSPHDNVAFYAVVEGSGADIVADDHVWGERLFESPIARHPDLMESLTLKFQRHSASIRSYPQIEQDAIFGRLVDEAAVDGVIFYIDESDDTLGWDYPLQKTLLDAKGVPSLYMKFQPYRGADARAQGEAVTGFLRSLRRPA